MVLLFNKPQPLQPARYLYAQGARFMCWLIGVNRNTAGSVSPAFTARHIPLVHHHRHTIIPFRHWPVYMTMLNKL